MRNSSLVLQIFSTAGFLSVLTFFLSKTGKTVLWYLLLRNLPSFVAWSMPTCKTFALLRTPLTNNQHLSVGSIREARTSRYTDHRDTVDFLVLGHHVARRLIGIPLQPHMVKADNSRTSREISFWRYNILLGKWDWKYLNEKNNT